MLQARGGRSGRGRGKAEPAREPWTASRAWRNPRRGAGIPCPLVAAVAVLLALLVGSVMCGCGGDSRALSEEEQVAERALRSAFAGEGGAFLRLVDPSFVQEARAEMPDADDETLGAILLSGFLRDIPYSGVSRPVYQVDREGEKAVVHVWGSFLDGEGREVEVAEGEALRVPLLREGGRWYLDLLDI